MEKELDPEKEQDPVMGLDPAEGLDPSYRTRGGRAVLPRLPMSQHVWKNATDEVEQLEGCLEGAEWGGNRWPVEQGVALQNGGCSKG